MRTDLYGQIVLSEEDICDLYLQDPSRTFKKTLVETDISFHNTLDLENIPNIKQYIDPYLSIDEFDKINQQHWFMPDEYKNMDIAKHVLDQCKNDEELQRAGQELLIFQERDMFMLLKFLKYLVDTMRKNNITWGVGRGSSVSSFVLYLIGIHRINSLYYDLSIEEFLK